MFLNRKFDRKTGVYRTKDNIDNFRFRVTLKTLHSFVKVPKFNAEELNESDDLDEIEFYNFQWQQKEFSSKELKRYTKIENCQNDRTKEYHKQITEHTKYFGENGEINYTGKIFSYINDDNYAGEPTDEQNVLAKNVRQFGQWQTNTDFVGDFFPAAANASDIQRARYKNLHQFETMYIMADLETETLLFTLKYRSNDGLLLIYPDLNSIEANPYLIEINADSRSLYQYAIEHLSVDGSNEMAQLRNDIEVMANKLSDLCIRSPLLFDLPEKRTATLCMYFEIHRAELFEYDDIHVNYEIHLPAVCQLIDGGNGQLKGCTHSSQRSTLNGQWLIGHCHELVFSCPLNCLLIDVIKITYEVISIDQWSRERSEGFAIASIPLLAGQYTEQVNCYRDLGDDTWLECLQRYFIGGRRKLLIDRFHGLPPNDENVPLNRYGNSTQSTGQLMIKRNVIVQRNIDEMEANDTIVRHRDGNRQKIPSLSSILLAYHRAREKLEAYANIN